MEAENGKEFDPAPSTQIPEAFAFSFCFLNVNSSVGSVTSVANRFPLLSQSSFLDPHPGFPYNGLTYGQILIHFIPL